MENGMQMTLDGFSPRTYRKQTAGVSDSPVRTLVSQENNWALTEQEAAYFSELCALCKTSKKKIDPHTYSLKTLKTYLALMGERTSLNFSLRWTKVGTMQSGKLSTLLITSHKTEKEFSLSDILEGEVPQKYFLSKEQTEKIVIGNIKSVKRDNPNRYRVYDVDGISPTLSKMDGGGFEPCIPIPVFCDMSKSAGIQTYDKAFCLQARYHKGICNRRKEISGICVPVLTPDREKRQNGRRFKDNGEPMFTLTGQDRHGIGIEIAGILRNVRTEYGKKIRKDYESGKLDISRHDFLVSEIRKDGVANTLSTVQKDNLLAVKITGCIDPQGRKKKKVALKDMIPTIRGQSHGNEPRVCIKVKAENGQDIKQGIFVQLSENLTVYAVWYEKYQCYIAIRKLTPRECFRLQGWSNEYFDRAELVNSDSQLYKQAGNGVTVPVIYEIAKRMMVEKQE